MGGWEQPVTWDSDMLEAISWAKPAWRVIRNGSQTDGDSTYPHFCWVEILCKRWSQIGSYYFRASTQCPLLRKRHGATGLEEFEAKGGRSPTAPAVALENLVALKPAVISVSTENHPGISVSLCELVLVARLSPGSHQKLLGTTLLVSW